MKRWMVVMIGVGMWMPVWADAHPPRPEEAVARLQLSDELRGQVLAVFEQARAKHDALRKAVESQRAANDDAFCAIRKDTRGALAKLLSADQMAALDAAMRPRPPRDGDGEGEGDRRGKHEGRGPGGPGGDGGPMAMRGRGPGPGGPGGDGMRGPRPPRCDDDSTP